MNNEKLKNENLRDEGNVESPRIEAFKEVLRNGIEDFEEAVELIKDAINSGCAPVISVPFRYVEAAKKGIQKNSTWIGEKIIAGTIVRDPYLPMGEKRKILKVEVGPDYIEPRFTGPDKKFHGVVVFSGPISPETIKEAG